MDAARRLFQQGQWDEAIQNINTFATTMSISVLLLSFSVVF